ncbi:MerR family transcriptional regulator [Roseovarius salinarum]|uniref:MerR family transcriptional regulator n=1 Tax=Roseovarius salinarum TaxID=1981892 RepID=UPI000C333F97|nr:MerR family transcriptional regulator [Roseovarius salinarum]
MPKSADAFRTISEVADWLGTPAHVLRFWESKFAQVKPVKRAGGRRYYRPADMQLLGGIKKLLHEDGMTIKGVQKILREQGVKHVASLSPPLDDIVDESRTIEGVARPEADSRPAQVLDFPPQGKNGEAVAENGAPETATQDTPEAEDAPAAEATHQAPGAPEPSTGSAETAAEAGTGATATGNEDATGDAAPFQDSDAAPDTSRPAGASEAESTGPAGGTDDADKPQTEGTPPAQHAADDTDTGDTAPADTGEDAAGPTSQPDAAGATSAFGGGPAPAFLRGGAAPPAPGQDAASRGEQQASEGDGGADEAASTEDTGPPEHLGWSSPPRPAVVDVPPDPDDTPAPTAEPGLLTRLARSGRDLPEDTAREIAPSLDRLRELHARMAPDRGK